MRLDVRKQLPLGKHIPICKRERFFRQGETSYWPSNSLVPMDIVRRRVAAECQKRGRGEMKAASLGIGRNHAYLSEFLRKSTPKVLTESDRDALAKRWGVPDDYLRDPDAPLSTTAHRTRNEVLTSMAQPGRTQEKEAQVVRDKLRPIFKKLIDKFGRETVIDVALEEYIEESSTPHPRLRQRG